MNDWKIPLEEIDDPTYVREGQMTGIAKISEKSKKIIIIICGNDWQRFLLCMGWERAGSQESRNWWQNMESEIGDPEMLNLY